MLPATSHSTIKLFPYWDNNKFETIIFIQINSLPSSYFSCLNNYAGGAVVVCMVCSRMLIHTTNVLLYRAVDEVCFQLEIVFDIWWLAHCDEDDRVEQDVDGGFCCCVVGIVGIVDVRFWLCTLCALCLSGVWIWQSSCGPWPIGFSFQARICFLACQYPFLFKINSKNTKSLYFFTNSFYEKFTVYFTTYRLQMILSIQDLTRTFPYWETGCKNAYFYAILW